MATPESLCPALTFKSWLSSGEPNAFGTLSVYGAGTTTPIATYTDSTGATPNANPLTLNNRGEGSVWLTPNVGYKFVEADSAGNLIKTTDQVYLSQLLTLYGGVDTGEVNAYVVNYSAPFSAYENGIVLYFIASSSNTGPSTLDVNGLGAVSIVNPNGSALNAGQILVNAMTQVVYQNNVWVLASIGALTGIGIGTFGPEVALASSNVTDLGSTGSHVVNVTGAALITSLGSSAQLAAPIYVVRFSGTPTLNASANLILPVTTSSIPVSAGDACIAEYLGGGAWKILLYQSVSAAELAAFCPAITSRASTITPAADPYLTLTLPVSGTYVIDGLINDGSGTSSGGLKGAIAFSGSSVNGYWSSNGVGSGVTTVPRTALGTAAEMQSAQSGTASMPLQGVLQASTPGTLSFEWSQESSNATASVVSEGSYLRATLISPLSGTFVPVTHSYNISQIGVETIPTGATTMTVEAWGGSGGADSVTTQQNAGAGSGGYTKSILTVSAANGQTMNFTVGAAGAGSSPAGDGGASSVSSGTYSMTTMAPGGGGANSGATPGAGGTATGGNTTNTAGNAGLTNGTGGAGIAGTNGTGGAGATAYVFNVAFGGAPGLIIFRYT